MPRLKPASLKTASKALQELKRRKATIEKMKEASFPEQWKFVEDESRLISALCTRRAGKSMAASMKFLKTGFMHPGCSMLYCGLTETAAWRILWKDCLKILGKQFDIRLIGKKSEAAVEMADVGSVIYFLGIDSNSEEMSKALGQKYRIVIVDEGAKYKQDLRAFVHEIAFPAVSDYEGSVCMAGMPSNDVKSFFYEVTSGNEPGWSNHFWTWEHNRYVSKQISRQVAFLKKTNPGIEKTSTFIQHYLGKWVVDITAKMYHFDAEVNVFRELPGGEWRYVLGIDLGYDDPTAFVVLAYRDYDPCVYVVDVYKRKNMTISEVAERIKHYFRVYKVDKAIIDGSAKQAVEELKQRHGIPLTAADKAGKADFIQICNDDLKGSRVKVKSTGCELLISEWDTLIWDEKALLKGIYAEQARAINHCADAFLYAWRYCYNWVDRGQQVVAARTDDEKVEEFWARQISMSMAEHGLVSDLEREYGITE